MDFEVKEMKEYLFGKKYLPHRSMIALVLGIVAGLLFYDFAVWVEPFGTAFMNLIKMLIVPVVLFSIASGIAAIGDVNKLKRVRLKVLLGDKVKPFTDFMNAGATLTYKMLDIVMIYSPIGIFALMANVTAVYGPQLFGNLAKFVATDWTGCLLIWLIYSLITKAYTKINYRGMCKEMIPIWVNTVATNSSSGTIPITMEATRRLQIPNSIASFSIPLGATINLTGAALYKTVLAFFVAQIYGLQLTMSQIIMVITISTLMSIAAPGIPGGGIVTGAIFLELLGLPMDLMGPISGMYRLIDMSHTTVNVSGDVLGTMLVAKNEHLWTGEDYNKTMVSK